MSRHALPTFACCYDRQQEVPVANTAVRTLCIMLRTGANSRLLEAAPLLGARARPARGPLPAAGASAPPPLRAWRCICIIWNGDMLDMLGPLRSRAALRSARAHEIFAQRCARRTTMRHAGALVHVDTRIMRTAQCRHTHVRGPRHILCTMTQCIHCSAQNAVPPLPNLSRCRTQL